MVATTLGRAAGTQIQPRSIRGRALVATLGAMSAVLVRLPPPLLHRAAHRIGGVLYHLQPARRALVTANLERVCRWLDDHHLAGPRVAAASRDRRALEHLVREAFGHYVRGYLEAVTLGAYAGQSARSPVSVDQPELVDEMLGPAGGPRRAAIIIGLHFGAIEIPALHAAARGARMTTPMETIGDPDLQAYMLRTRSRTGLRVIPTRGAGRELAAALGRDEPVVIVADRVVDGSGSRVELFGAQARLPLGPAALAVQSGAPAYVVAARRVGAGRYRVRIERVPQGAADSRRQRLAAFLDAQARLFERIVADAPEQWWTLFFPIWEAPAARKRGR